MLLLKENLNHESLLSYAREAASYSTNHQLPSLDFAPNYSGQPDVDMFDFTSMFSAENASRVIERRGHLLLIGLVGDTLLEVRIFIRVTCARDSSFCLRIISAVGFSYSFVIILNIY